jgi:uncharacterized hydrophobic protein (TIGR00271 family)
MAINEPPLLKKSLFNYLFAAGVGLATSTIYFAISPLNEAHSEILARTAPNIYDVLIAFFGGLAGMLATSSRSKGNVIPGVAIATALMPPLCTAGYGLATTQFNYFFGAFYLFLINSVFIALATFLTAKVLKFPVRHPEEKEERLRANRIFWTVVVVTLVPSIYFGYDIVRQTKFKQNADRFVAYEAVFPNNYLFHKDINPKKQSIILTFGGEKIEESDIENMRAKLGQYGLEKATFEIRQGFAYLSEKEDDETNQLMLTLNEKEKALQAVTSQLDSLKQQSQVGQQIFEELKIQYPALRSSITQPVTYTTDSTHNEVWLCALDFNESRNKPNLDLIERWLKVRLQADSLIFTCTFHR